MKKILSIVLAVALCLTAMVGCLTVSADGAATATVATVEVDAGTATADVAITIAGNAIAATYIDVALPELALVGVASATDGLNAMHNSVNAEGVEDFTVADAANAIRILLDSAEGIVDYTSLSVVLTFNTANAAAGEYAVTVTGSDAADSNEAAVVINPVAGAVVVKEVVSEPVLDANISIAPSISIGSTLEILYIISGVENYASFEAVVSADRIDAYSGFNYVAKADTIAKADMTAATADMFYFVYDGIAMFELNIPLNVVINCYDEAGNKVAYSTVNTTSMKQVAVDLYNTTKAAKTKTILTDLLNLGAAAQTYFGTNGTDLASIALPNDGFDQTYASVDYGTLNTTKANTGLTVMPSINLAVNPGILYIFSGVADGADLSATVSYYDAVNQKTVNDTFDADSIISAGSGMYYIEYNNVALYAGAATVTTTLYNGSEVISTFDYSLETCISENIGTARIADILTAVAKFGKSAQAYFGV